MEDELIQLRDIVLQLRAENERLRQEPAATVSTDSIPALCDNTAARPSTSVAAEGSRTAIERLVLIPRDRKCPMFRGNSGMNIDEWVEEARACMRARHLAPVDQAFFLVDHLEGEARDEIKYRSDAERGDPEIIIKILQELYGCCQSYVALQEAFFSREQQEGESLHEFSLALMRLLGLVKRVAPVGMLNFEVLLRDQFIEYVSDCSLRRELKQLVRRQPTVTLLDGRGEAIRWEREGMPGGNRGRSHSVPSVYGLQYGVQGGSSTMLGNGALGAELGDLKAILQQQQDQLNQLTQSIALLQNNQMQGKPPRDGPVICRRCQRPGHFARECYSARVPFRSRSHSVALPSLLNTGPLVSQQESEN